MQNQSKYDVEAEAFRHHFFEYREKKIVIYGIGRRTLTLLPRIEDFNIVGLLDRDPGNTGRLVNNTKVISLEDAEAKADIIIINSDPSNYLTIFRRISQTSLPIFFSDGKRASKDEIICDENNSDRLWDGRFEEIKREIDKHDIITFDIFDTLLARKASDPADVFDMMQGDYTRITGRQDSFREARQRATDLCNDYPGIEEIYAALGKSLGLDEDCCNGLLHEEVTIEKKVLYPRTDVVNLYKYAVNAGKKVYLISDMYLGKGVLSDLINKCTDIVVSEDDIIVSCDRKAEKADGRLWNSFINMVGCKSSVLHIGDNPVSDENIPMLHGINCIRINSGEKMLDYSCFKNIKPKPVSLNERIMLGLFVYKRFNSPFISGIEDKLRFNASELGYCVFGPIIYSFMNWMLQTTENINNRRIVFLARDGYFLHMDYEYMAEQLKRFDINVPDSKYLPISRRIVLIAALPDEQAWKEFIEIPFAGTFSEYMRSRFNVEVDDRSKSINNKHIPIIEEYLVPYKKEIEEELSKEKKNYISYLKKEGLMESETRDVLIDLGCQGTNQYFLQKITKKRYIGRFLYANLGEDNNYLKQCDIKACFQHEDDPGGKKSPIRQNSAYLESFLTAPYGMIKYLDEDGNLICESNKTNQKMFDIKEQINEGAKSFIQDMIDINRGNIDIINRDIVNEIYKDIWSEGCCLDKDVAASFVFDNDMIGSDEQKLFE